MKQMLGDHLVAPLVHHFRRRHTLHGAAITGWEERGAQHYRNFEIFVSVGRAMVRVFMNDLVAYETEVSNIDIARNEVHRSACGMLRTIFGILEVQAASAIQRECHVQQRRPTINVKWIFSRSRRNDLESRESIEPVFRVGSSKHLPIHPEVFPWKFFQSGS